MAISPTSSPSDRVSVFSAAGLAAARQQPYARVVCGSCGHEIPIRPADIGLTVVCPSCRGSMPVGERLAVREPPRLSLPPTTVRREIRFSPWNIGAVAGIAMATAVGLSLTWRSPRMESPSVGNEMTWKQALLSEAAGKSSGATAGGSGPRLRRSNITLAAIDELAHETDASAALAQAQLWDGTLAAEGVPPDDPRRSRLTQLMRTLQAQLVEPPPPPPPCIAEFRRLNRELRDALIADDLSQARRTCDQAVVMLTQHPTDLAPYARSFGALRQRLTQAQEIVARVPAIEQLLRRAHEVVSSNVTEARECEARAKFLAWQTPLAKQEVERLDALVRELQPKLLLARGTRAVQEAEACLQQGPASIRDLLVAEARETLPGLPESQILELLVRTDKVAKAPAVGQEGSAFGQAVMHRRRYEETLNHLGSRRLLPAVQTAAQALETVPAALGDQAKDREKLADLVFLILETAAAEQPASDSDRDQAKQLLQAAQPFASDARWDKCESRILARGNSPK